MFYLVTMRVLVRLCCKMSICAFVMCIINCQKNYKLQIFRCMYVFISENLQFRLCRSAFRLNLVGYIYDLATSVIKKWTEHVCVHIHR